MSLLHRIPPLVSALAFGYGVGMSAPDAALSPVQAAVVAYGGASSAPQAQARPKAPAPSSRAATRPSDPNNKNKDFSARMGGSESPELGRLRDVVERDADRGASCDLER